MTAPSGWRYLNLCVDVARDHPDWDVDQIERRATALWACQVTTDEELEAIYRAPRRDLEDVFTTRHAPTEEGR